MRIGITTKSSEKRHIRYMLEELFKWSNICELSVDGAISNEYSFVSSFNLKSER